jgi:histidine ammonia-lyase
MYRRVVRLKLTDVSEVHTASIITALTMEAVRTSEMSVNFNVTTLRYIPEDSKLHTRRRENLKSHM